MIRRCETQEQATESDMRDFAQQRRPSTKTGKCLHACLMEHVGLVSRNEPLPYINIFVDIFCGFSFRSKMANYRLRIRSVSWAKWQMEMLIWRKSSKKLPRSVKMWLMKTGKKSIRNIRFWVFFWFNCNPFRCEMALKIMTCTEEGIQKRQEQLRKFMPRHQQPPQ